VSQAAQAKHARLLTKTLSSEGAQDVWENAPAAAKTAESLRRAPPTQPKADQGRQGIALDIDPQTPEWLLKLWLERTAGRAYARLGLRQAKFSKLKAIPAPAKPAQGPASEADLHAAERLRQRNNELEQLRRHVLVNLLQLFTTRACVTDRPFAFVDRT